MNITYPTGTTVPVILSGTTQLGTPGIPDLGGTVLEDEIRTFTAGKGRSIRGTLQDRVVQMNDTIGTLAFYSWIKEFNAPPGTPGITEMYFDWLVSHGPPTTTEIKNRSSLRQAE